MFNFLLLSISFIFQIVFSTVLNIEELNSIHYNIDIINNPVLKNQEWATNIVTITNKHGQEYICTLPEVEIPENESKKEEDPLDYLVDISELLKPMEVAPCLNKKKDWWSYEFCYGSVIKQYHLEDNKVVGTILILGKYESEYNWRNNTKSKNKLQKFHTQYYVNGTRCDITGEPRRTEVRFQCEEGVGDYIQQVDEPESCRYVIIIATTRVCHHPYLKPNPNRTPYNINCAPALNQEEFNQYQKIQEMKDSKVDLGNSLHLDEKTISDEEASKDDANLMGSDNTGKDSGVSIDEEDSHFSIRLVTIPIPQNRRGRHILKSEINGLLAKATEDDVTASTNENTIDSILPEENSSLRDNDESANSLSSDAQKSSSSNSYLNLNERLEKEFMKMQEKETKEEGKDIEEQPIDTGETKGELLRLFATYITQINKVEEEWTENKNEKPMDELLDPLKTKLYKYMENIEKVINKYSESNFFNYFENLIEILDKYKKLLKAKYSKLDNKEQVMEMLQSMITFLSELDVKLLNAFQKMKLNRMEKYLDAHLKGKDVENQDNSQDAQVEGEEEIEMEPLKDSSSDSSHPLPLFSAEHIHLISNPSKDQEGMDEKESEELSEDQIADPDEGQNTKESQTDTQDVQILNENPLNSNHKTKLEQSIKERLEKSGLDNIGRKIEVKILTPNYLDDDEKNTQSLSQEETEAFHNMIVNILSASAEELKERERHKNLESSYNFRLEQFKETISDQMEENPEIQNLSPEKTQDDDIDNNDVKEDDLPLSN